MFHHPELNVAILVHGDDFVAVGSDHGLAETRATLENKYKLKGEVLGEGQGCVEELRILNKVVRYTPAGVELEADPRHAELVVRELGLLDAKASRTPGVKDVKRRNVNDEDDGGRIAVLTEGEYIASHAAEQVSPTQNSENAVRRTRQSAADV